MSLQIHVHTHLRLPTVLTHLGYLGGGYEEIVVVLAGEFQRGRSVWIRYRFARANRIKSLSDQMSLVDKRIVRFWFHSFFLTPFMATAILLLRLSVGHSGRKLTRYFWGLVLFFSRDLKWPFPFAQKRVEAAGFLASAVLGVNVVIELFDFFVWVIEHFLYIWDATGVFDWTHASHNVRFHGKLGGLHRPLGRAWARVTTRLLAAAGDGSVGFFRFGERCVQFLVMMFHCCWFGGGFGYFLGWLD